MIESIVGVESDLARVEQAEQWRDSSAALFYGNLARKLEMKGFLNASDLRPPDAAALLRFFRIGGNSVGTFSARCESGCASILAELSPTEAFDTYAAFPTPLPENLVAAICNLPEGDKRKLVKSILGAPGSPLSDIHLLHVLSRLAGSADSKYWRLARLATRSLLNTGARSRFAAFKSTLEWVDKMFGIWPDTKSWSVEERLAMVWGHGHRLFSTFMYLGLTDEFLCQRFRQQDFGLAHTLFEHDTELCQDISHPRS